MSEPTSSMRPDASPTGTRNTAAPVTLREILGEMRDETLQWDHGLPGTFRYLCTRPATVVRSYLWERSARFTRPLRYLLLTLALALLVNWLLREKFGIDTGARVGNANAETFLRDHAAVLTLLLLPLMAAIMRLCCHGLRLRYVDALVTLTYTQGQVHVFGMLIMPVSIFWPGNVLLTAAISGALALYLLWAWASVLSGPLWRRVLAVLLTFLLSQTLNSIFVLGVARAIR